MAMPIQVAADIQAMFEDPNDSYLLSIVQAQPVTGSTDSVSGASAEFSGENSNPVSQTLAPDYDEKLKPERLVIPDIKLDAPILVAGTKKYRIRNATYEQWIVPNQFAAGWSPESGYPGQSDNVVLFGHHNVNGAVFANLYKLQTGSTVTVYAGGRAFNYIVSEVHKVKEKGVAFDQMIENAKWIQPTGDERLTLVTCWPPYQSTYRLIVVALPAPQNGEVVAPPGG
jgi:LPXTG-site transpeptidase (sortase) family protein